MPFYAKLLFLLFYKQLAVQFIVHIDDHTRTQAAAVTKARRAGYPEMPSRNRYYETKGEYHDSKHRIYGCTGCRGTLGS
jgi:hypothetical protein